MRTSLSRTYKVNSSQHTCLDTQNAIDCSHDKFKHDLLLAAHLLRPVQQRLWPGYFPSPRPYMSMEAFLVGGDISAACVSQHFSLASQQKGPSSSLRVSVVMSSGVYVYFTIAQMLFNKSPLGGRGSCRSSVRFHLLCLLVC